VKVEDLDKVAPQDVKQGLQHYQKLKRVAEETGIPLESMLEDGTSGESPSYVEDYNANNEEFAKEFDEYTTSRPKSLEEFYQRATEAEVPLNNIKTTEDLKKVDPILKAANSTILNGRQ